MDARDIGKHFEDLALAYLKAHGLALVARNFNCRFGEVDLILREGETIVFAEVRYRGTSVRGGGTASVGAAKRAKLIHAAQTWLQQNPRYATQPCRFDVVGCSATLERPQFEWTRNAFDAFGGEMP